MKGPFPMFTRETKSTLKAVALTIVCCLAMRVAEPFIHRKEGTLVGHYVVKDVSNPDYPSYHYCVEVAENPNVTTTTDCAGKVKATTWTFQDGTFRLTSWPGGGVFLVTAWDKNPLTLKSGEVANGRRSFDTGTKSGEPDQLTATTERKNGHLIVTEVTHHEGSKRITRTTYDMAGSTTGTAKELDSTTKVVAETFQGKNTLFTLETHLAGALMED